MRFVPANCLREGMKVAKTLYGKDNQKLLVAGAVLVDNCIASIKRLKYPGVYIDDDISKEIEIKNVISDELRLRTVSNVKKMFLKAEVRGQQKIRADEIRKNIESIIDELIENNDTMINMVDLKFFDDYTYGHSVNVAVLTIIIGMALGLRRSVLIELGSGALMHDIGKVFINKCIISKPGKLTDEEYHEIQSHSLLGYQYLKDNSELPPRSYDAILDHHEKFDGTGYPNGKKGNEISLFGRITSVSDVYDALTSERPYRSSMNPSEAMEYIMGGCGTVFDPKISGLFIRKIAPYPIGTMVKLSNGYIGLVIENFESFCLRPTVKILKISGKTITPFEVSLKDDFNYLNVTIQGIAND